VVDHVSKNTSVCTPATLNAAMNKVHRRKQTSSSGFFLSSGLHAAGDTWSPAPAAATSSGFGDALGDTCIQNITK